MKTKYQAVENNKKFDAFDYKIKQFCACVLWTKKTNRISLETIDYKKWKKLEWNNQFALVRCF